MNSLKIPPVSQVDSQSNAHHNDCGVASLLGDLRGYKLATNLTVDQLYDMINPDSDDPLSIDQLSAESKKLALELSFQIFSNPTAVFDRLYNQYPILALIHYGTLVDAGLTQFKNFSAGHFVNIIGIDIKSVIINDPYRTDPQIELPISIFWKSWGDCYKDNGNQSYVGLVPVKPIQDLSIPPTPVPTVSKYQMFSTINGVYVYYEPIRYSTEKTIIWRGNTPVIDILEIKNGLGRIEKPVTGWVWLEYFKAVQN